jgi:Ca2+-binding EF-hand superfamily protein
MSRADSDLWRAKMRKAFSGFDVNGNGYITSDDIAAYKARTAEAFGYSTDSSQYTEYEAASDKWTGNMFSRLDKSGDDQISLEEFMQFFAEASEDDIAAWCDSYAAGIVALAASEDGLTKDEYVKFAVAHSSASEEEAEAGFAAIDTDGSGYISQAEFARFQVEFTVSTEDAAGNQMFGAVA